MCFSYKARCLRCACKTRAVCVFQRHFRVAVNFFFFLAFATEFVTRVLVCVDSLNLKLVGVVVVEILQCLRRTIQRKTDIKQYFHVVLLAF